MSAAALASGGSIGRRLCWFGWGVMAISAVGVALISVPFYLTLNASLSRIPLNPGFPSHLLWLSLHAVPGGLALLIGPFQFVTGLRTRHPMLHRLAGRVYLLSVLVGSLMAVPSALMSTSGFAAQIGFLLLAAAWFYSGYQGFVSARRRQFALHRVWMIRNYALTFAAVLLRVFLLAGTTYMQAEPSVTFGEVYTASVWASILVSTLVAEWFIVGKAATRGPA